MRKELGKIQGVSVGLGGYQEAMLGIHFTLGDGSWGVNDSKCFWDANQIDCTEHCKWTEEERTESYADTMRYISNLLSKARVDSVNKLLGIPIEAEFDGNALKGWRILEEVL